jgi:DNA mismatch endonuclease (patch repair protein)
MLPERPWRADVVFTRQKIAIFIDGCYWHKCPIHGTTPKSNVDYWGPKLERNVERDRETDRALIESGWLVLRFWEHDSVGSIVSEVESHLIKSS